MTKDQVFGIIQSALSTIGGFLVTKGITDSVTITTGIGVVLALVGMVWSITDHTANDSSIAEALRQAGAFVGGIFVQKSKLSTTDLDTYLGFITTFIPIILSIFAKQIPANATPVIPTTTTATK